MEMENTFYNAKKIAEWFETGNGGASAASIAAHRSSP